MNVIIVENYDELSKKASEIIANKLNTNKKTILGLATGSTPIGTYQELIKKYHIGVVNFENVYSFNLDEYVGLEKNDKNSYYYFMQDNFFRHINIKKENTHIPNGTADDILIECKEYEEKIANFGGIDLQILGLGSNGHIGFNEPGTSFSSLTHLVQLDKKTRQANARFFTSLNDVPTHAITAGIQTIMNAKEILLLISGNGKKDIIERFLNEDISENVPATVLKNHSNVIVVIDKNSMLS